MSWLGRGTPKIELVVSSLDVCFEVACCFEVVCCEDETRDARDEDGVRMALTPECPVVVLFAEERMMRADELVDDDDDDEIGDGNGDGDCEDDEEDDDDVDADCGDDWDCDCEEDGCNIEIIGLNGRTVDRVHWTLVLSSSSSSSMTS